MLDARKEIMTTTTEPIHRLSTITSGCQAFRIVDSGYSTVFLLFVRGWTASPALRFNACNQEGQVHVQSGELIDLLGGKL
jgi:hypothetical protein